MERDAPLPDRPALDSETQVHLIEDAERYAQEALPFDFADRIRERYRIELGTRYGGFPIRMPFGKASGQLSLQAGQVRADARAGLGFVVLKTVIAQDADGARSMGEWAIPETKMLVERIRGEDGMDGWTVTWKGRGWYGTFEEYCDLFREALDIGRAAGMLVVPSCKYHLPPPGSDDWRVAEYEYTTDRLVHVWRSIVGDVPMPIEKDFSPTLAGDDRSSERAQILEWVRRVPALIRRGAGRDRSGAWRVRVGLKLMNAVFDEDFQIEMIRAAVEGTGPGTGPDWLTYANRLFDPTKEFEGKVGVAYGGPDLSRRNLRVLRRAQEAVRAGKLPPLPPISATGNILTGRTAVRYALLGAENFQMHTLFQLPNSEFDATLPNRTGRALHRLLFHPAHGYLAWMTHLRRRFDMPSDRPFSLADLMSHTNGECA